MGESASMCSEIFISNTDPFFQTNRKFIQDCVLITFRLIGRPRTFTFRTEDCLEIVLETKQVSTSAKPTFMLQELVRKPLSEARQMLGRPDHPNIASKFIETVLADREEIRSRGQEKVLVVVRASETPTTRFHAVLV